MASAPTDTSRRQFFPAALAALGRDLADPADEAPQGDLLRLGRRAMGCRFEVILPADGDAPVQAAREALDLVDDLERQMTIYRDDSELSAINRAAAAGPVAVEPRLFGLLQAAARLSDETGGAFDITAGPLGRMGQVRLDAHAHTVAFARDGVRLDLAGIGKGYALDRVAQLLASRGVQAALVHGGHSSLRALGRPPWDDAWVLSVQHPLRPQQAIATIRLRDRAMATSAVGDGTRRRHLLDPRTGRPAQGAVGATVVAPTAAQADALSTACCVMGADETRDYCRRHPGVGALLLESADGNARPVAIGLADDEVEVAP